jgi:ABC-type branched-subunit amino acid transport system substrate-binding protein
MRCGRLASALVVTLLCSAGAQESDDPREVLGRATAFYRAGQYDSTVNVVRSYVKRHGKDPSNEYLVPLLLEALVREGEDDLALRLTSLYFRKYPESDFVPRLYYLQGIVSARQEDYQGAVLSFSRALQAGVSPTLDSLIECNVRTLCEKTLTSGEIGGLVLRGELHPRIMEIVRYNQVRKLHAEGRTLDAERAASEFARDYPQSPYRSEVKDVAARSKALQKAQISIGLLVPVSGYDADIGRRIVEGVQFAVDAYNREGSPRIDLVIQDTKSSMVETVRATRELIARYQVPVIIGPVLSENTVVAASMVLDKEVVLISPTATADGIAELGPNIFQLNVTMGTLGRRLAGYAMENLNIREFAVVSPLSEYGRILSEGFKEEVLRRGGTILIEDFFDEGANDFRPQFESMRVKLLDRRREQERLEVEAAGETYHRSHRKDSLCLADSALPIGGLFLPAEADDVVMLAPQVFFYKIRTQMLGATGWHNPKTILDGKQYVNNAIIVTNFETDMHNKAWQEFSKAYHRRYNHEPDRVSALGYDAAQLVCGVLATHGGDVSARRIIESLHAIQNHAGVSGTISFDPSRGINREAAIVKISDRKFIRVE